MFAEKKKFILGAKINRNVFKTLPIGAEVYFKTKIETGLSLLKFVHAIILIVSDDASIT